MTKSKYINLICVLVTAATLLGTMGLLAAYAVSRDRANRSGSGDDMAYETGLFNDSVVHTLDIVIDEDDWADLLENALSEEYYACDLVLDGDAVQNVAIRAKGNTSLNQVASYGNDRYSLKLEFDHYETGKTYQGLDKLALNNLIQDNTCMKDYLCYKMMAAMGVETPLCSFLSVTVNGEEQGLYLAVEGVEESFAQRSYGADSGQIYKPDFEAAGSQGSSSDALKLQYTDDNISSYGDIFDTARFDLTSAQQDALIQALKTLASGADLDSALDVDEIIRYFVVHNFVLNGDSYTGSMLHNYYLHQSNGHLSLIAWDYNLAFGGFSRGNDATALVNYPIDDPLLSASMEERPMIAWIFNSETYTARYHQYFDELLVTCFDSGWFEETFDTAYRLIAPYVEADDDGFVSYSDFVTACDTLRSFVTLRAESVRSQLDGTIPASEAGQSKDSSSLIDASTLTISDMGSSFGGGTRGENEPSSSTGTTRAQPDSMATPDTAAVGLAAASDSDSSSPAPPEGAMEQIPADGGDNSAPASPQEDTGNIRRKPANSSGQRGGKAADAQGSGKSRSSLLLSGGSVLLLIAALILVSRYRRRRF